MRWHEQHFMSILKMNFSLRKVYSSDIKFHLCRAVSAYTIYYILRGPKPTTTVIEGCYSSCVWWSDLLTAPPPPPPLHVKYKSIKPTHISLWKLFRYRIKGFMIFIKNKVWILILHRQKKIATKLCNLIIRNYIHTIVAFSQIKSFISAHLKKILTFSPL